MAWTYAGVTISQPGVIADIDNSGASNSVALLRREIVIVGRSGGGEPKKVLSFTDINVAKNALVSGEGLTAVLRALKPSTDPRVSPGTVKFVRVDPAARSSYNVLSGATTVIQLKSVGYGDYTNRITTQITTGTNQGLKSTVTLDNTTLTKDDLYKELFSVQYTGTDTSGLITVSNATGDIQGLSGGSGTETVKWTASFSTYSTVQQLVNFINSQTGWVATMLTASPNTPTLNALDDANAQPAKTSAFNVKGTLQAVIDWFNATGIVAATRPSGVGLLPTAMTAPDYLTGGTDGTPTNTDWSDAFAVLQNEPLARIIVPLTSDDTIHAMGNAHCDYMSQQNIRKNRVQIVGGAFGETVSQQVTRAQNLNSRRTSVVWPGIQDIDPVTFTLTSYAPYMVAAQSAGILSSLPITQALTRQVIAAKGLEGTLQSTLTETDYNTLTDSGVMAIRLQQNSLGNAYVFVRSVTTWLQDTKLVNIELSVVANEDYVSIIVGDAVDALVGRPGMPIGVGLVISVIDSELRKMYEEGIVVGGKIGDAYGNINVSLDNGAVLASYDAVIPAPMNFFGIRSGFSVYSTPKAA